MTTLKLFLFILASCCVASSSLADIYEWTDENGLRHYTNQAPPSGSRLLMITKEEPYDKAADLARMEAEERERLEQDRLAIAQRETELELREAVAARKLAEADRLVREAMREADNNQDEAYSRHRVITRGGSSGWCRDCDSSNYDRWYYRSGHRRSTYLKKRHHLTPYQSYPNSRKLPGTHRKLHHNRYRGQVWPRHNLGSPHKRHYPTYKLNTRSTHKYNVYRRHSTGSRSTGFNGRGNFSRGWSSGGMRR